MNKRPWNILRRATSVFLMAALMLMSVGCESSNVLSSILPSNIDKKE